MKAREFERSRETKEESAESNRIRAVVFELECVRCCSWRGVVFVVGVLRRRSLWRFAGSGAGIERRFVGDNVCALGMLLKGFDVELDVEENCCCGLWVVGFSSCSWLSVLSWLVRGCPARGEFVRECAFRGVCSSSVNCSASQKLGHD
ncbi:hypothetical protein Droror1_Dr00013932 [Drosera rotundifolia]